MDFILSFLLELFVTGCEEGSKSSKLPGALRTALAFLSCAIDLMLIGFSVYAIFWLYEKNMIIVMVLAVCVLILLILGTIAFVKEVMKLNTKLK
jgi:high-affinity Fe2+/Pb2+ permease